MVTIIRATKKDYKLLAEIGQQTFIESHGASAKKEDLDIYLNEKYSYSYLQEDLNDLNNIYHIIFHEKKPAGFSKIILNSPVPTIQWQNITKLEKLFLLKEFYSLKLGAALFNFNLALSKSHHQSGIWLFAWTENHRALNFYIKNGFQVIANHNFKISPTHSNPNYQMFLKY